MRNEVFVILICQVIRSDLDGSSVMSENKFPAPFNVVISVGVDTSRQGLSAERCASWKNIPHPQDMPLTCFTSSAEQKSVLKDFSKYRCDEIICL